VTAAGEQVLVVPRASIVDGAGWLGIRAAHLDEILGVIARDGRFEPRASAETDPSLKQVIPYLVLRDGARVFLMRRTQAGGDARLHDRWSIGVGGHLNPGDGDVNGGLRREWAEEIEAGFVPEPRFVGLLNDDTTDVGSVHVGLVFEADAAGRPVGVRETEKLSGSFVDLAVVREVYDGLETWSQLILPSLDPGVG
jgi:predicted NUDIX family phosphoesterase